VSEHGGRWFYVDGRLTRIVGDHDDINDQTRELRADGHVVRSAPTPKVITPRLLAKAAAHRRGW
jgi:hypothetical protein